ncbi:MAG: hypothetical protein QOG12_864 [Verrucomicrobiota bacterium]|jgi:hypothetical protein
MVLQRLLVFLLAASGAATLSSADDKSAPAFRFKDVDYFHRWSGGTQHEFTPARQEDLDHWSDMITVNVYPDAGDGEELADAANNVLENYKNNGGKILNTRSVPPAEGHPAEHFISVAFTRPDLAEAAFARFKLQEGKGYSFVYSHHFYGKKATDEMNAWLKANGEETENALMKWEPSLETIPAE